MKILLMTLNSKYIHSNLAIHSIYRYWVQNLKKPDSNVTIDVREFTINNDMDPVLSEMHRGRYDVVFVSAYIWNIELLTVLIENYNRLNPETLIFLGGPEVSYNPFEQMSNLPAIHGVFCGEGEESFTAAVRHFLSGNALDTLHHIPGIATRYSVVAPTPVIVSDLDSLPFPYESMDAFSNRIVYYESTRGCPYSCSYCLSSSLKGVRRLSLERVYSDMKKFLEWQVPQVKFVDRTFNLDKKHALSIMQYLVDHDNGVTNFHFEINGNLLDSDYFALVSKGRKGLFQFEIGIQSTCTSTLTAINRNIPFEQLKENIQELIKTQKTHVHVDLIAGLPLESYKRFLKSFDDAYNLGANQLQLGFLKVLKGTALYGQKDRYGYKVRRETPYEVLENNYISFDDLAVLKEVEKLVEWYHNSERFKVSFKWLLMKTGNKPSELFLSLRKWFFSRGLLNVPISTFNLYLYLDAYYKSVVDSGDEQVFNDLLKYDYYASGLRGQRDLFHYPDIPRFNKRRIEILDMQDVKNHFVDEDDPVTPKEMLKYLEFVVFKHDVVGWISETSSLIPETNSVVVFNMKKPYAFLKLGIQLFKGDAS
ncbi:B12-binding domain-containing radical SAM protein [Fusibacter tunisiensis]|uniref:Radical SAM superfamily enzyme YgiQ (UPF0313 family) n=1 Tax=Fusibacter tunisiensis TaxID=1008308 RepID=A0ABS2MS72_9FIRM|nr:DUF4080 domain-containing protein [Fusibacter tunisiensis]MBM7562268.1 radical SAM superfamily enzyme YgiQ (UPF0313 family) [Fusibacter tunisiensis]